MSSYDCQPQDFAVAEAGMPVEELMHSGTLGVLAWTRQEKIRD